jgi:DNA-binding NarL/FixJ family response regulator
LPDAHSALTREHLKIIRDVALGDTDAAIARRHSLSESTVRRRLKDIAEALGVRGRAAVVAAAVRGGILELSSDGT